MGFNNGYDAGWQDAINAVKYGKVPGLGPISGGAAADTPAADTPAAAFNAGVLEGYDVEKLLSADDLSTYLATLSDTDIKALLDTESNNSLSTLWESVRADVPSTAAKLGGIFAAVLNVAHTRGLIYNDE